MSASGAAEIFGPGCTTKVASIIPFCSGLPHLRLLSFGVVTNVTDKGLLKGLGRLTDLQELCLYDTKNVTDLGFEGMAESLESLKTLSLSKCHRLTNGGLASLAR